MHGILVVMRGLEGLSLLPVDKATAYWRQGSSLSVCCSTAGVYLGEPGSMRPALDGEGRTTGRADLEGAAPLPA